MIVRPTLVYGAGAKGNFLTLLSLVDSGIPLPFASVKNRRSLIGVENLSELLALCVEKPAAAGELFLAAEAEVHSTPGLIRSIAQAMRRPSRLFGIPERALRLSARLVGFHAQFDKTCGSLEVRSSKTQELLAGLPSSVSTTALRARLLGIGGVRMLLREFVLFLTALVASAAITWLIRRHAIARGLLDVPNVRSSHTRPTPRGGGLGIVLTVLVDGRDSALLDGCPAIE